MTSINNLFSKKYIKITITIIVLILSFLISLLLYGIKKDSIRRTFVFPSVDAGKYVIEYRNLYDKPYQGQINYFVEEILLGSTIERTKTIFTPGTKLLSCFERGNTLYVNLSSELLNMGKNVVDIKEGMELLQKNIKLNFTKVHKVEIFVNGKAAFEN